ncbi:MAG: hypothetical protein ACRDF4_00300, partial [Rhabdochlamydiaceae bacterium]
LIPVVWDFGGCAEIVPSKWQFSKVEEASRKIMKGLDSSKSESESMRTLATRFSAERFRGEIAQEIELT